MNVSFDLQNKLSSSKMIQKDVQQVKIYTLIQNHQDSPVTIEKNTLKKNLANSYLEKAQPWQPVAVKHYEVHTRAQLMHGRARIDK